jgi:hypothetical protein
MVFEGSIIKICNGFGDLYSNRPCFSWKWGGSIFTRIPCKSKFTLVFATSSKIIYLPTLLYSVFLPLKSDDLWFYIGLPITLLGLIGSIIVAIDWLFAKVGDPVTRGF